MSFDTRGELEDKIDKLTVMLGRLAAKDNDMKRDHLSLKYTKVEEEYKTEVIVSRNYQNRNRLNNRPNSRDRGQFRQDRVGPRFEQNYRGSNFWDNARGYGRQNSRGDYRSDSHRYMMVTLQR